MQHLKAWLVREHRMHLVDLSLSGCRFLVDRPFDEGSVGELRATLGGKQYQDTVHVLRADAHRGTGGAFALGVRFAWGTRPGRASIRGALPSTTAPSTTDRQDDPAASSQGQMV